MGRPGGAKAGPPGWFVAICVLIWSAITLVFDGVTGYNTVRQERARAYIAVPAVVTASDLKRSSGEHGPVYSARISFRYTVAGREYIGTRWRYGEWSSSDSAEPRAVLARYPVGAQITARYRPTDPADAVLEAGLGRQDTFMALFLGPFNAAMLAGWCLALGRLRVGPCAPTPLGGARATEIGGVIRVRLRGLYPPVFWGLAAYGGASLAGMLIAAFAFRMRAPIAVTSGMVGAAALLGLIAWGVSRARLLSGRRDLLIDRVRKVVTLPPRLGGGSFPFESIEGVQVADSSMSSNGGGTTGMVVLMTRSGKLDLFQSWTKAGAEQLADFLRARLACPPVPASGHR